MIVDMNYGIGWRKTAVVWVFLKLGFGNININGCILDIYFGCEIVCMVVC